MIHDENSSSNLKKDELEMVLHIKRSTRRDIEHQKKLWSTLGVDIHFLRYIMTSLKHLVHLSIALERDIHFLGYSLVPFEPSLCWIRASTWKVYSLGCHWSLLKTLIHHDDHDGRYEINFEFCLHLNNSLLTGNEWLDLLK